MSTKKPIKEWRIQAISTLSHDIPATYPGGPSHKKGANFALASTTKMPDGNIVSYLNPSAIALSLSVAIQAAKQAITIKPTTSSSIPSPEGPVHMLHDHSALFDYFEQCFVAVTFSFQAIEAYSNYKIAYKHKGSFELSRDGKSELLTRESLERLSTEEKLSIVLPKILSVDSPKGRKEWKAFVKLKQLRNSIVHLKSHHQWNSSVNFDDSPYSFFLRESPMQHPLTAMNIIRWFAGNPEKPWLDGAEKLLSNNIFS